MVEYLLENGADPSLTTNDDETNAWIIGLKRESPKITKSLENHKI